MNYSLNFGETSWNTNPEKCVLAMPASHSSFLFTNSSNLLSSTPSFYPSFISFFSSSFFLIFSSFFYLFFLHFFQHLFYFSIFIQFFPSLIIDYFISKMILWYIYLKNRAGHGAAGPIPTLMTFSKSDRKSSLDHSILPSIRPSILIFYLYKQINHIG